MLFLWLAIQSGSGGVTLLQAGFVGLAMAIRTATMQRDDCKSIWYAR